MTVWFQVCPYNSIKQSNKTTHSVTEINYFRTMGICRNCVSLLCFIMPCDTCLCCLVRNDVIPVQLNDLRPKPTWSWKLCWRSTGDGSVELGSDASLKDTRISVYLNPSPGTGETGPSLQIGKFQVQWEKRSLHWGGVIKRGTWWIWPPAHLCVHACMHVHVHTCTFAHMHSNACICMLTGAHVCVHAHTEKKHWNAFKYPD